MQFKEHRMMEEYFQLSRKLRLVLLTVEVLMERFGAPLVLTSVIRTEEEQRELCKKRRVEYRPSTHQFGRAVDIRISDLSIEDQDRLVHEINTKYQYDPNRPSLKTALLEEDHIHIQVM